MLRRSLMRWVVGLACVVGAFSAAAQPPKPPEIAAKAYLLMDITSGQVLASKDPDASVEPASLTKMMTAYVVLDAIKSGKIQLTQKFSISERAWKMPGSRMFIEPKMEIPVGDLINGMIVQSGNDAATALAEGVGGSVERFVDLMNQQAKALRMKSSSFKNPEGLTVAGHTTTATDLAILASRLMHDFPEYLSYSSTQHYRYPGTPAANDTNRNLLLFRDPSVDGLKTGHTSAAGYCLVATSRRPIAGLGEGPAGQRRLLSVMLGASSESARAAETQKLLNWGYTAFDAVRLTGAGQALATPKVWKGKAAEVKLGKPDGVVISVPAGEGPRIKTEIVRPDPLVAPILKGQSLGVLRVTLASGEPVTEVPLTVLETVEESGFIGRTWDALRLWIQ